MLEGSDMGSSTRSGYESLSIGYLLIAFAASFLLAWLAGDWWLLLPVFMLAAGAFYVVLGALTRPSQAGARRSYASGSYSVFWGGTLMLLGAIWLINREYPDNVPILFAAFIIWLGAVAVALSLPRFRRKSA